MKQRWQQLTLRIDALSLRERGILFAVLLMCSMLLADTLWLSPAQMAHKQAALQLSTQSQELQRLRDELRTMAVPVDVNQQTRDEIAQVQLQVQAINQEIEAVAPQAAGGPAIESTLVQLLRRQEGLTLLGISTAPTIGASTDPTKPVRQTIELRVSGSYAELTRYIATLENTLPTLRWGTLLVQGTPGAPELKAEMFLLGVPE